MTEFNDRPLVAGSVVGIRAFRADDRGVLMPVTSGHTHEFTEGINEAECQATVFDKVNTDLQRMLRRVRLSMNRRPRRLCDAEDEVAEEPTEEDESEPKHVLSGLDCSCGFYAYTTGENGYMIPGTRRVAGIVEGTGTLTIGQRGFRASKVRIVALILNPGPKGPSLHTWQCWLWGGLTLANANTAVRQAADGHMWWGFAAALMCGWSAVIFADQRKWRRSAKVMRAMIRKTYGDFNDSIRQQYPNVPTYPTEEEAVAAHPLTDLSQYAGEDD